MKLTNALKNYPADQKIIINSENSFSSLDILNKIDEFSVSLNKIDVGSVVAIIGNFDVESIACISALIDKSCIVVPLTSETKSQHKYFFEVAHVQWVFENGVFTEISSYKNKTSLIESLRTDKKPGLVLFSSGTTGKSKAILHNFENFLEKYETANKNLKSIAFLLFDHIGGINTFFYTMFSGGQLITPTSRDADSIFKSVEKHGAELLPVSPTFLRLALRTIDINSYNLSTLKIISYGTEVMDQQTLDFFNKELPFVNFRQTYGMSELGILSVKSESSESLFLKLGSNVEFKVEDDILFLKSPFRMLGYLNSESPFDDDGWYNTKDIVEKKGEYFRIKGRDSDIINIGGIKVSPLEVEEAALKLEGVLEAKAFGVKNPLTGFHIQLDIVTSEDLKKADIRKGLKQLLPQTHIPSKLNKVKEIAFNHRFKRM